MHEDSLVRALLRQVEDLLRQHTAARATRVKVTIGEFSGVEPDLLELAFARQAHATAARGARLNVERVPLTGSCQRCSQSFVIRRFRFVCPSCESSAVTVTGGEQLILDSVTMETDE